MTNTLFSSLLAAYPLCYKTTFLLYFSREVLDHCVGKLCSQKLLHCMSSLTFGRSVGFYGWCWSEIPIFSPLPCTTVGAWMLANLFMLQKFEESEIKANLGTLCTSVPCIRKSCVEVQSILSPCESASSKRCCTSTLAPAVTAKLTHNLHHWCLECWLTESFASMWPDKSRK